MHVRYYWHIDICNTFLNVVSSTLVLPCVSESPTLVGTSETFNNQSINQFICIRPHGSNGVGDTEFGRTSLAAQIRCITTALSYVYVYCNCRFSLLPPVIFQCKRLEILVANDNQISDIDADSLCQMPMIATLALQNNNISTVPPQLGNCTQLRFLLVIFRK